MPAGNLSQFPGHDVPRGVGSPSGDELVESAETKALKVPLDEHLELAGFVHGATVALARLSVNPTTWHHSYYITYLHIPSCIATLTCQCDTPRMTASTTGGRANPDQERDYPDGPGDIPADTFALRLMASRHHAGRLSIEQAATRCGLNPGNWAHWENGRIPSDKFEVAEAVAEGLGMNLMWLLRGGTLLPAKGRRTKRATRLNPGSVQWPIRPADTWPIGRPLSASPAQATRRPRIVDRTHRLAV